MCVAVSVCMLHAANIVVRTALVTMTPAPIPATVRQCPLATWRHLTQSMMRSARALSLLTREERQDRAGSKRLGCIGLDVARTRPQHRCAAPQYSSMILSWTRPPVSVAKESSPTSDN